MPHFVEVTSTTCGVDWSVDLDRCDKVLTEVFRHKRAEDEPIPVGFDWPDTPVRYFYAKHELSPFWFRSWRPWTEYEPPYVLKDPFHEVHAAEVAWAVKRSRFPLPTTLKRFEPMPGCSLVESLVWTEGSDPSEWEADAQIVKALSLYGGRLTTTPLLKLMERLGMNPSDSTVKKRLAKLVNRGVLRNEMKARPRGYELVSRGASTVHEPRMN